MRLIATATINGVGAKHAWPAFDLARTGVGKRRGTALTCPRWPTTILRATSDRARHTNENDPAVTDEVVCSPGSHARTAARAIPISIGSVS